MLYLVIYERADPKNQRDLITFFERVGATHILDSVWIVSSADRAATLRNVIKAQGGLAAEDRILVVRLANGAAWSNLLVSDAEMKDTLGQHGRPNQ